MRRRAFTNLILSSWFFLGVYTALVNSVTNEGNIKHPFAGYIGSGVQTKLPKYICG